jgi:signal transduction histidine kinase
MNTPLENEIAKRFGILPNFFRLASCDPAIASNLWGFARFAYLDNPLPSLFKERLFVYLSRFCEVRYCIARHVGFLAGLGHPAGDSACQAQLVEVILPLLRRPLPVGEDLLPHFAVCARLDSPLASFPQPDSPAEQALFACATHVFLQTPNAPQAHEALRHALGPLNLERLNLVLAFVRTAHYWTKLHPELALEDDISHLLATNETLAQCILNDPEAQKDGLGQQVAAELTSLRKLRQQHESMTQAYQALSADHQLVKHSLFETEENLRELVAVMPAGVYACDRDGIITYYNPQAAEIWGRKPKPDELPWSFLDSRHLCWADGTPLQPEDAPVKQVLVTGVPVVNREFVLERPDLSRINVLANITPLRDSAGFVTGAVSILQNINELKRSQQEREALLQELERSNRELSEFSYAVSHDLQAPLRGVRALTQLLVQRDDSLPADSSHLLTLIEQSTSGMARLIESLLRYAQAGQGQLNRQLVKADQIVESVRMNLAPDIAEAGARIICNQLPTVEADPVLLGQVFQNLIANALQYHHPGEAPVIEISGGSSEGGWQFTVQDNGQGIPFEQKDRVFEPLKRLHGSDIPGSGLGLALCRTIVARHGGRIWVESAGSRRGAIFRFTLSAAKELPPMPPKSTAALSSQLERNGG